MLYTLAPDLLLGWPRANRADECAFMLPDVCARPELGRITGRGNTANLEVVVSAKPDLIVDIGSTSETYASLAERVQQQTGIPYALLDGRFVSTPDSYKLLGQLLHRERDGADFADYCNMTLATITERIASIAREDRPRLYYARGPRGLQTGGRGSINVETAELLARNAAEGLPGGLVNVSLEQVLAWDPDVIVTIDRDFAASVRTDPAWASIRAVRAGRVHLSPMLPFGWVDFPPSVNRLIGLWWLAKLLYPQRFPEDMAMLTRDFYTKFYRVTPTDAQIAQLLNNQP
jgi:iron complex transport system substrate-binding protein